MRKKQTYEELANSTLAKLVVKPVKIPYNLPNDNTTAVAEFKRMLAEDEIRQIIGEEYRAATTAAARESGPPREYFEKLVEHLHPYLVKGKQIYLEGLATSWRKDDDHIIPQIEVNYGHNIQLLGEKMSKQDSANVEEIKSVFNADEPPF